MKAPDANGSGLTIGRTARLAEVGIPTMRFYERAGLLPKPMRTAANYRLYPEDVVTRIRFIRRAQQLGFTLREIKELLELRVSRRAPCAQVQSHAENKMADIEKRIRSLRQMKRALTKLAHECESDVEVLDALLDAGADIEAPGAVIGGGTPLADAVAFGQWKAARRLVERGARTSLAHAAALGLMDRVEAHFAGKACIRPDEITHAFWYACHGGQQGAAEYLLGRGADLNWIPEWERRTPLDAASRSRADDVVVWLRSQGAKSADQIA